MRSLLWLICISALIAGCTKSESFVPVYSVPAEFVAHVNSFQTEAATRGINITLNNLIIEYDSSMPLSDCARANVISADPRIQKKISINPNIVCWNSNLELETLIYHELGHCILGREHLSALLSNGDPKSIMEENNISLYSPCIYPIDGEPCDQSYKRQYYVDELFNEQTPTPYWAE